jgi:hypothetical protein
MLGAWRKLYDTELGENRMTRSFVSSLSAKCIWNDQVKDNDIGEACSTHGLRGMRKRFCWESKRE